ncbi:MAG: YraN family protein [Candidatus Doudnabacteria bacterium]|nr:YraN family protein [Candidatus Doudnabacteria bacterium]
MLNWLKKISENQKPKTLGQIGEEVAQKEYIKQGFKIIAKNEYNKKGKRLGEIDFIAKNKQTIVFVEVKSRQKEKGLFGSPVESVNTFKQIKILKAVKLYLLKHQNLMNLRPQIDVCTVILTAIDKNPTSVKIYSNVVEDWN